MLAGLCAGAATSHAQEPGYEFTPYDGRLMFVRMYFPADLSSGHTAWGYGTYREPPWHHDYPHSETNLTAILKDVTYIRALKGGNVIADEDPQLLRFPVVYVSEPGYWTPTEKGVANIRAYLRKGGFMIFDDFSSIDLPHLLDDLRKIVPDLRPMEMDGSEPIFHTFFDIAPDSLELHGYRGRRERERYMGLFEGNDRRARQIAILNVNNDVGEFMEYNETGFSSVNMTNEAFKLAVNYYVYAMTH